MLPRDVGAVEIEQAERDDRDDEEQDDAGEDAADDEGEHAELPSGSEVVPARPLEDGRAGDGLFR